MQQQVPGTGLRDVGAVLRPNDQATELLRDLVSNRWSCRSFDAKPVSRSDIESVLDIARQTPSWCNTQPWHVHVTEGQATDGLRQALRDQVSKTIVGQPDIEFPAAYEGAYRDRRKRSGWQLYDALGIAKGDRIASGQQMLKNFDLFDAPHVAIVTTEKDLGPYGAVDCGLFVSNFLLAAHSRGIATIPQAALATQAPVIREFFGLPPERQVLLGISFGYPNAEDPVNHYRTERQTVGEIVTFVS